MIRVIALLGALLVPASWVQADVIFSTDLSEWESQVDGHDSLTFTSTNVAFADEVGSPPGSNAGLGPQLTFQGSNTGFDYDFSVQTLEPNAGFTFDDNEGDSDFNDALSIGDINNFENDDFRFDFTGTIFGFGMDLRDIHDAVGETFSVFDAGGLIGNFTAIPEFEDGPVFVGVVSDTAITHVIFDEDAGGDDIAIRSAFFATSIAVPEPTSSLFILVAAVNLNLIRRKRSNL